MQRRRLGKQDRFHVQEEPSILDCLRCRILIKDKYSVSVKSRSRSCPPRLNFTSLIDAFNKKMANVEIRLSVLLLFDNWGAPLQTLLLRQEAPPPRITALHLVEHETYLHVLDHGVCAMALESCFEATEHVLCP